MSKAVAVSNTTIKSNPNKDCMSYSFVIFTAHINFMSVSMENKGIS